MQKILQTKKRNVFIAKFGRKMFHCYLVQRMFVALSKNISNHLTAKKDLTQNTERRLG